MSWIKTFFILPHYEALCIEKQLRYLCIAPDHVMLFILSTHNKTELFIIRHHKYICNQSLKRFFFYLINYYLLCTIIEMLFIRNEYWLLKRYRI